MSELLVGCATISHTRIELLLSSVVAALLDKLYPHGVSTLKKHKPHMDRQKWCCTLSCRAAYNTWMQISEAVTATHMHVLPAATMNDDCILMCSCTHNHEWTGHISSYVVQRCLGQMGTHNRELIESDCHGCRTPSHETSHRLLDDAWAAELNHWQARAWACQRCPHYIGSDSDVTSLRKPSSFLKRWKQGSDYSVLPGSRMIGIHHWHASWNAAENGRRLDWKKNVGKTID